MLNVTGHMVRDHTAREAATTEEHRFSFGIRRVEAEQEGLAAAREIGSDGARVRIHADGQTIENVRNAIDCGGLDSRNAIGP